MKQLTDERLELIWARYSTIAEAGKRRVACMRAAIAADRELNNLTGEAQPAREWVSLTDEDFRAMGFSARPRAYAAIESRLREKNAAMLEAEAQRPALKPLTEEQDATQFNCDTDCEKNHHECEAPELCSKYGHCMGA